MRLVEVMVPMPVSAAFRLESCLDFLKICTETAEHVFDHVIGSNKKDLFSNFGRQVSIAQVPGKADQLKTIFVSDFNKILRSGYYLEPSSIVKSQPVPVGHGNCLGKVQKDIFSMVCCETDPPAMTRVEIKCERAHGVLLRPMSGGTMNGSALHDCSSVQKIPL